MESFLNQYFMFFALAPLLKLFLVTFLSAARGVFEKKEKFLRVLIRISIFIDLLSIVFAIIHFPFGVTKLEMNDFVFHGWDQLLVWNHASFYMLVLVQLCISLIARFSMHYLHRDVYIFKFYAMLYLFQFSTAFLIFSESTQFIFVGSRN